TGLPPLQDGVTPIVLRNPDAVIVDPGGTTGKLQTPTRLVDQWFGGPPRLDVPTRTLAAGDDLLVNDRRVTIVARAEGLPRYPPRPLMYTTFSNALSHPPPRASPTDIRAGYRSVGHRAKRTGGAHRSAHRISRPYIR